MTQREFYTAIVNAYDIEPTETQWEELKNFAIESIAKLDARNAKRASKPSKTQIANEPIKASIVDFIGDGSCLASQIASGLELSVSKVSALCRQLVADGVLMVEDAKVKGKGTQKLYSSATLTE